MVKISYELKPRDVLFFRDARPMDVDKGKQDNVANVGHGANWPRPDQLFSAIIHTLIRDVEAPDEKCYGEVKDLRVTGPFPHRDEKLFLPLPLDWDMKLIRFDDGGMTDIPTPLEAGFADRSVEKKDYPKWISTDDFGRYLKGEVGKGKGKEESDNPTKTDEALFLTEPRVCTTLDANTGASKRVQNKRDSGQYEAEYLRLGKNVAMICDVECEEAEQLKDADVRFGGQGGLVRFEPRNDMTLSSLLEKLSEGKHKTTRYVRWTLLTPALFIDGWYPNWLNENGKVMFPAENVARKAGESRAAYRNRMKMEMKPFDTAHLIAARIGDAIAFSGYDSDKDKREKPTELAVPAGSCYVFECQDEAEAELLFKQLNLKARSDLGEKGFGFGICSYIDEPKNFKKEIEDSNKE